MNTPAIAIRLTPADRANIATIRKSEPWLSQTAAVRLALEEAAKKRRNRK